jgi:hypothetical protein
MGAVDEFAAHVARGRTAANPAGAARPSSFLPQAAIRAVAPLRLAHLKGSPATAARRVRPESGHRRATLRQAVFPGAFYVGVDGFPCRTELHSVQDGLKIRPTVFQPI